MRLERLEVVDFRNHPAAAVDLPPGVALFAGPNGVGKTSLLEAVGYLDTLGSHRAGQDSSLVRAGAASIPTSVYDARFASMRPGPGACATRVPTS